MGKTMKSSGKGQDGKKLTARERTALKRHAEACIDAFMRSVGYTDVTAQTDEDGWRYFRLGSARGCAFVVETEDDVMFHTEAKVMDLPGDKELILPLFRELLELNLVLSGSTCIGIRDNMVLAAATESARLIGDEEYGVHIHRVMAFADAIDDRLQEKYKGTSQKRASK